MNEDFDFRAVCQVNLPSTFPSCIVSVLIPVPLQFNSFQESQGRNLLTGPVAPSPVSMMKRLINQRFTEDEIIDRQHELGNKQVNKVNRKWSSLCEHLCLLVLSLYVEAIL
jgi:hypothetical protein